MQSRGAVRVAKLLLGPQRLGLSSALASTSSSPTQHLLLRHSSSSLAIPVVFNSRSARTFSHSTRSLTPAQVQPRPIASTSALPHTDRSHTTNNTNNNKNAEPEEEEDSPDLSRGQKLKILFRKHGWSALVVYLALSAVDFGLCFILVSSVGADKVRQAEDWVLEELEWRRKDGEPGRIKQKVEEWKVQHGKGSSKKAAAAKEGEQEHARVDSVAATNKVKEQQDVKNGGYSALATTAVLAYAIHKTLLLPFRVGVTVWITPKVVRQLQAWGWPVGLSTGASAAAKEALKKAKADKVARA